MQSSLGYSQIKRFNQLLKKRREIFKWYQKNLRDKNVRFIVSPKENNPNYWFPAIITKTPFLKQKVIEILSKNGVETRSFFLPIHLQPVYKSYFENEKHPIAEYFFERGLLLPSYYDLLKSEVWKICRIINQLAI